MMVRAVWKGFYLGKKNYVNKGGIIFDRALSILNMYIGKTVQIYNGKKLVKFNIEGGTEFHKFGEFAMTRKMGRVVHNLSKKRNVLKKKK